MALLSLHKDYDGVLDTFNEDFDFMDIGISKVAEEEKRVCVMCNEEMKQDEFILFSLPRKYITERRKDAIKKKPISFFLSFRLLSSRGCSPSRKTCLETFIMRFKEL